MGKFKGHGQEVPHCTRWAFSPKSGELTSDKALVTCSRCCKQLEIPVPPKEETVSKNPDGTCACCFASQKVQPAGVMYKHGYRRPGYGYIIGGCPGDRFPQYEKSIKGTQYMLGLAESALKIEEKKLVDTENLTEIVLQVEHGRSRREYGVYVRDSVKVTIKPTDSTKSFDGLSTFVGTTKVETPDGRTHHFHFQEEKNRLIMKVQKTIQMIKTDIIFLTQKVAEWSMK